MPQLLGTGSADTLHGTNTDDVINAGAGNDLIRAARATTSFRAGTATIISMEGTVTIPLTAGMATTCWTLASRAWTWLAAVQAMMFSERQAPCSTMRRGPSFLMAAKAMTRSSSTTARSQLSVRPSWLEVPETTPLRLQDRRRSTLV